MSEKSEASKRWRLRTERLADGSRAPAPGTLRARRELELLGRLRGAKTYGDFKALRPEGVSGRVADSVKKAVSERTREIYNMAQFKAALKRRSEDATQPIHQAREES